MCLQKCSRTPEGKKAPAAPFHSPVTRDYPSRPAAGFSCRRGLDCSFKEQFGVCITGRKSKAKNSLTYSLSVHLCVSCE